MRLLVVITVLAGCIESAEERLDHLSAEADIECWKYFGCAGYYNQWGTAPTVAIEQAVSCMNDALASGARAAALWGAESSSDGTYFTRTSVFTVDHEVKVFKSLIAPYEPTVVYELRGCEGPFRVHDFPLCGYRPELGSEVYALAWDGCP